MRELNEIRTRVDEYAGLLADDLEVDEDGYADEAARIESQFNKNAPRDVLWLLGELGRFRECNKFCKSKSFYGCGDHNRVAAWHHGDGDTIDMSKLDEIRARVEAFNGLQADGVDIDAPGAVYIEHVFWENALRDLMWLLEEIDSFKECENLNDGPAHNHIVEVDEYGPTYRSHVVYHKEDN